MNGRFTLSLVFGLTFAAALHAGEQGKTVWDGVYTTAQASSGQAIFTEHCAGCHGLNLAGGAQTEAPPLKGVKFMENWREDSLGDLFTKIHATMPRRSPKSLSEKEAIDLVSYILQENEFPAGAELTSKTVETIQIQGKDGPKPLPNYAIVQVVGCMAQDGDNWTLTRVGQPARSRSSEKPTPEELKAADKKTLGNLTFRLQNLAMLGAFNPEEHKSHKMLAKGPLIRQSNVDRISVTELEMIGPACGP